MPPDDVKISTPPSLALLKVSMPPMFSSLTPEFSDKDPPRPLPEPIDNDGPVDCCEFPVPDERRIEPA